MPLDDSFFALSDRAVAKGAPALIAQDDLRFAAIAGELARSVVDLERRLDVARRAAGGSGEHALERDLEVHRLTARLRLLSRYGVDLCLGRMVHGNDPEPVYIGRIGLRADDGRRLLLDWRSPAAAPFFAATLAQPMGLSTRRRYRWAARRVTDFWDEVLDVGALGGLETTVALDDESALIASLDASRSPRMRDVLGTIQADQDAIIRADSRGALVVDGGPGTGKTVVALHRAAYLRYSDARVAGDRGGLLFVGPSPAYLDYVADVLPSLGEDGVRTCTLRDLVPEGATAGEEADPRVAGLKGSMSLVRAVEKAVRRHEVPPDEPMVVETEWSDVRLDPDDWADAFDAVEPDAGHNDARPIVWRALVGILVGRRDREVDADEFRAAVAANDGLRAVFDRAWPVLDADAVVRSLWTTPALLRRCAPELDEADRALLRRADAAAWTASDLPLLDAARARIGARPTPDRDRRRRAEVARELELRAQVADELIAADDGDLLLMSMLRRPDVQQSLADDEGGADDRDRLVGPFAHVVVDEAQELTDAEWAMLVRRAPSRSLTVVGDRAQARSGFAEGWVERLARVGLPRATVATLSVNYRTPDEIMQLAGPLIRAALPDASVPTSVRTSGSPVRFGGVDELDDVLDDWAATDADGVACVIAASSAGAWSDRDRVRRLTPVTAKGLEFDLVVLVDPSGFGEGLTGAVDRYVAMTRATRRLVVLESSGRPDALTAAR